MPFSEEDPSAIGPPSLTRWGYACSKLMDEFLGLAYWHEYGLPVVIVRYFNTVGPRQTGRYGMVLPTFVRQALANHPLTVYGDGQQSRCFGFRGRCGARHHRAHGCGQAGIRRDGQPGQQ